MADAEIRGYERAARSKGMTLSEWARAALRKARDEDPVVSPEKKLGAIRAAARHHFPAPDIDRMLAEIEHGYGQGLGG